MNKRIRELADEARKHFPATEHSGEFWVFDEEKFAELIVRECARAIINDKRLNDVRSAANGCVKTLREHFGVEE